MRNLLSFSRMLVVVALGLVVFSSRAVAQEGGEEAPTTEEAPPAEEPPAEEEPPLAEEPPPEEPPVSTETPPVKEPPLSEAAILAAQRAARARAAAEAAAQKSKATAVPVEPPPYVEQPAVPPEEPAAIDPPKEPAAMPDEEEGKEKEEEEDIFSWFSVAPQVGFAYFPESKFTVEQFGRTVNLTVKSRKAFVGKIHLDLGGDGIALEISPFLAVESDGSDFSKLTVNPVAATGGVGGDFIAVGGQLSLVYRFGDGPFFPHLGLGFHGAYLISDAIEYGAELYGRIPLGFTWYFAEHAALVMEIGFLYGVTGIKGKVTIDMNSIYEDYDIDPEDFDPDNPPDGMTEEELNAMLQGQIEKELNKAVKFGKGFGFDALIGIRFP